MTEYDLRWIHDLAKSKELTHHMTPKTTEFLIRLLSRFILNYKPVDLLEEFEKSKLLYEFSDQVATLQKELGDIISGRSTHD